MKTRYTCLLMSCLVVCLNCSADSQSVIGVSTPLTGDGATYGADIRNILLFANETLAGNRYKFIFEDDRCSGKDAVSAAQKLTQQNKVKYVLGHACSGALLSSARIYQGAKAIVISPAASAPEISQSGDYIFRTWPSDAAAAKKLADYIRTHHQSIGILSEQTEYAQAFSKSFKDAVGLEGLKIEEESFQTDNTDQRSLLLRLKGKGIEALFLNTQTEATLLNVVRQVHQMKLTLPIYNAYWASSPAFLEKAGELSEGIISVDAPNIESTVNDEGKKLYEQFLSKYGKPNSVPLLFATTYESFRALHEAIESKQDVREYLLTHSFNGVLGKWSFDKNGDSNSFTMILRQIRDGRAVPVL